MGPSGGQYANQVARGPRGGAMGGQAGGIRGPYGGQQRQQQGQGRMPGGMGGQQMRYQVGPTSFNLNLKYVLFQGGTGERNSAGWSGLLFVSCPTTRTCSTNGRAWSAHSSGTIDKPNVSFSFPTGFHYLHSSQNYYLLHE